MIELKDIKTTTYWYKDTYCIDIVETADRYESYLYNTAFGIKMFVVGVEKADVTKGIFLTFTIENIENSFLKAYQDEFEQ